MKAPKHLGQYLEGSRDRDPRLPRAINVDMGVGRLAAGWYSREALIARGVVVVIPTWVDDREGRLPSYPLSGQTIVDCPHATDGAGGHSRRVCLGRS